MDLSVYKNWGEERLEYALEKTPLLFPKNPPMKHQKIGFLAATKNPRMIFRWEMGTGKTALSYFILNHLVKENKIRKALVLSPRPSHISEWLKSSQMFSLFPVKGETGDPVVRRDFLINSGKESSRIIISDYYTMMYTLSKKLEEPRRKKNGKIDKRTLFPDEERIKNLSTYFDCIICDEIHKLKNKDALISQIIALLSENIYYRYGLTGTLFDKSPSDVWAQSFIIDRGKTFGSYWYFQKEFFKEKYSPFTPSHKKWEFNSKRMTEFKKRLNTICLSYETSECADLPPIQTISVALPLPIEYNHPYDTIITEMKNIISKTGQENSFMKMRQLMSGLIPLKDDNGNTNGYARLSENPKLEWILEFLDDIPENKQVIIFHDFIESGTWICETLKKNKISFSRIYSGTKNKEEEKEKFLSGKTRVMVGNTNSIAEGFNFQNATYSIFYESPVSSIIRAQAERRSGGRLGSTAKHTIYNLFLTPSLEETIIQRVYEGMDLHKAITETTKKETL